MSLWMPVEDPVKSIIGGNAIDRAVVESEEMLGKECCGCMRILPYIHFNRDSSYRDGRKDLCVTCESVPRLSTAEHTARLREQTNSSHGVGRQRLDHQEDYKDDSARVGRRLHHSDFLGVVKKLVPSLYVTDGNIQGELALFRTYPCGQPRLNGRDFEYLFYCPTGYLPEFSLYDFDDRDIPIRERERGWRTVLLRLIKSGLLSEEIVDHVFGKAVGPGSNVYNRKLYEFRNRALIAEEVSVRG